MVAVLVAGKAFVDVMTRHRERNIPRGGDSANTAAAGINPQRIVTLLKTTADLRHRTILD